MKQLTPSSQKPFQGWQKLVKQYQQPDTKTSIWQIINSIGGFLLCWILMYFSWRVGYWLTFLISIPAAGFLVRIFIIQHDCGHASFFKTRKANDWVGRVCSVFTFTPYAAWRKSHAIHHAHHADLEDRGTGDVWTMTVEEYNTATPAKRRLYRFFRNPIFLFIFAPVINFVILHRFPLGVKKEWKNGERASVRWTNISIGASFILLGLWLGFLKVFLIQLPIVAIAASVGTWLFYVQHQFEDTYWEHKPEWDYTLAAMEGSSYYKLPKILQWFTGNIGFHHIHHLSPRIPNYKLEACHNENPLFQNVVQLTLLDSFETMFLTLWDEGSQRLITFREAKRLQLTT